MYNYRDEVYSDIKEYVLDEFYSEEELRNALAEDYDSVYEELYDAIFISDRVTGNGSGSYFFSSYEAGEALAGNFDLLSEALETFGCDSSCIAKGEEYCDVTIRCYLVGECLSEFLEKYRD